MKISRINCLLCGLLLGTTALADGDLSQQVERRLGANQSIPRLVSGLLADGHEPQAVAEAVLAHLPWEAPAVAVALVAHDPAAAPLIAPAVAAMARADPAPVAAAVARVVPGLAPEVAASTAVVLPERAGAVLAAVLRAVPGALPEVSGATLRVLPAQAGALSAVALEILQTESPDAITRLLPVLAGELGAAAPERLGDIAGVLLAAVDDAEGVVGVLTPLLEPGAWPAALAPRLLAVQGGVRWDGGSARPGQVLAVESRFELGAGARLLVLAEGGVCALLGPATLRWTSAPFLEEGLLRCAGPEIRLQWPGGELAAVDADLLLGVGRRGAGVAVFAGTLNTGDGETLAVGLHRLGESPGPMAGLASWLAALGMVDRSLGDLGEPVVWMAGRLGWGSGG